MKRETWTPVRPDGHLDAAELSRPHEWAEPRIVEVDLREACGGPLSNGWALDRSLDRMRAAGHRLVFVARSAAIVRPWVESFPNTAACIGPLHTQADAARLLLELLQVRAALRAVLVVPREAIRLPASALGAGTCPYRDPTCPCQDGLACHYEGDAALPRPALLDWLIVRGPTGPNAWPMHPQWLRSLRHQAKTVGVAFAFDGWGDWQDGSTLARDPEAERVVLSDGAVLRCTGPEVEEYARQIGGAVEWGFRQPCMMARVGADRSGRLIDDREHQELPAQFQGGGDGR